VAQYLIVILRAMVIAMWAPAAAFAAVLAGTGANASPLNVPAALVVATALFSTLAGATTLALRLVSELRADPDKPLVKPWLYCLAHMLGSWCAGAFFFLIAMAQGYGVWTLLASVLLASFVGAKALEMAAERWLPTILPKGS
jgi:hypothetical protein